MHSRLSFLLGTHHHDRAVGVTNHKVGDATHPSPPYSPVPPTVRDDEPCPYLLSHQQDLLGPMAIVNRVGYLQVLFRDLAPVPLYLLDLLIEDYLCSLAQLLYHFRDPGVVGTVAVVGGKAGSDHYQMKLRVSAGGHIYGGDTGQLGVLGAVGGQKDLGRKDAHLLPLLVHCVFASSPANMDDRTPLQNRFGFS